LGDFERIFNTELSSVRTCVEWGYQKVDSIAAFQDFKKNLKLRLQPLGCYFPVACVVANFHTCLYGSQTTSFFDKLPPSLEEYAQNMDEEPSEDLLWPAQE
jgi:hypothetical protein